MWTGKHVWRYTRQTGHVLGMCAKAGKSLIQHYCRSDSASLPTQLRERCLYRARTKQHGGNPLQDKRQPGRVHGVYADAQQLSLAVRELVLVVARRPVALAAGPLLSAAAAAALQALVLSPLNAFLHSYSSTTTQ